MAFVNGDKILYETGLVRRVRVAWSGTQQFILTVDGRLLAKALLISPAPSSAKILQWRHRAEDFIAKMAQTIAETQQSLDRIPIES